jgi:hypothetical protein
MPVEAGSLEGWMEAWRQAMHARGYDGATIRATVPPEEGTYVWDLPFASKQSDHFKAAIMSDVRDAFWQVESLRPEGVPQPHPLAELRGQ